MKTSKRWGYLNDFQKTADGSYIYTGAVYTLAGNGKRYRGILTALCFGAAAVAVGSGCINAAGLSNTFYVILPYIGEVAGAFALCYNAVRLLAAGEQVKAYVRTALEKYLPPAVWILIVSAAVSLVASPVFLILNGTEGKPFLCGLYLVLKAVALTLGILTRRHVKTMKWDEPERRAESGERR